MTLPRTAAGPAPAPATSGLWRSVARSAGARLLVLPVSAVLGLVVTRLVISSYGPAAFAQYGLLVGLALLLPFADLGLSASLMNVVAESPDPATDPQVRGVLVTAVRLLVGSAVALVAVTVTITVAGWWPSLLGRGLLPGSGSGSAGWCLALIAVGVPLGIGQRVLTGLGRNHVSVIVLGLQTPLVLVALLVMIGTGRGDGGYVAVLAYAATTALSVVLTLLAARSIHPAIGTALRAAVRVRSVHGARVFATAWPMLVQMVVFPIAMQTDRVILSHVSDLTNLARYNLASQMFTPVWQVVSSAGVALWPIFARQRAAGPGAGGPGPTRVAGWFGAGAAAVCVVISLCSPWLAELASGGAVRLPPALVVSFSLFMVVQAAKYPLGMYLTDVSGLRFQALMMVVMLPVNFGLSWWLGAHIGAVGPVIGSIVGVVLCQVVGPWWWIRTRRPRRPVAGVAAPG